MQDTNRAGCYTHAPTRHPPTCPLFSGSPLQSCKWPNTPPRLPNRVPRPLWPPDCSTQPLVHCDVTTEVQPSSPPPNAVTPSLPSLPGDELTFLQPQQLLQPQQRQRRRRRRQHQHRTSIPQRQNSGPALIARPLGKVPPRCAVFAGLCPSGPPDGPPATALLQPLSSRHQSTHHLYIIICPPGRLMPLHYISGSLSEG
jgi:hypothetical protein